MKIDEVLSRAESRNLSQMVAKRRIQLTGPILRLPRLDQQRLI